MESKFQCTTNELNKKIKDFEQRYKILEQMKQTLGANNNVLMKTVADLQNIISEKECKFKVLEVEYEKVCKQLKIINEEHENVKGKIEIEIKRKTVELENQINRLNNELKSLVKNKETEINNIKQRNAEELEIIEKRVKKADRKSVV